MDGSMPITPELTVAAIVADGGRFLVVEELVKGRTVINQPAGHVEPGETLLEAVVRETREETARPFTVEAVVGIYWYQPPAGGNPYLRVAFAGQCGPEVPGQPLDDGILRATWFTREELVARGEALRSPMVLQGIDDFLAGRRLDAAAINALDIPALARHATRL
jgi:8-oxo-dGTP pyrophosphatase MutT (NUDIX family)